MVTTPCPSPTSPSSAQRDHSLRSKHSDLPICPPPSASNPCPAETENLMYHRVSTNVCVGVGGRVKVCAVCLGAGVDVADL